MPTQAQKNQSDLLTELPDNTSNEIVPEDIRDVVVSCVHTLPTTAAGDNIIQNQNSAYIPLTIQGASSQSAALVSFTNSSAVELSHIDASGNFSGGLTSTLGVAHGGTGATTLTANKLIQGNTTSALSSVTLPAYMSLSGGSLSIQQASSSVYGICYFPVNGGLSAGGGAISITVDGVTTTINGSNQLQVSPATTVTIGGVQVPAAGYLTIDGSGNLGITAGSIQLAAGNDDGSNTDCVSLCGGLTGTTSNSSLSVGTGANNSTVTDGCTIALGATLTGANQQFTTGSDSGAELSVNISNGTVGISGGNRDNTITIDNSGGITLAVSGGTITLAVSGGTVMMTGLPSSDPSVAGALYTGPAGALFVSGA